VTLLNGPRVTRREFLRGVAGSSLLLAGCPSADAAPPNVVVVLIDQLRKDHAERDMPRINALARRGVVFEEMRSTAPWTYPSVISLFSGLYPQQHGADGHLTNEHLLGRFEPGVPLLHKILRSAGYTTAAFITNPFLLRWNAFHQGFDTFDAHFIRSQGPLRPSLPKVWVPETMFANSVNEEIRAQFDLRPRTAPEFIYIHYIDVHGPWRGAPFPQDYSESIRFVDEKTAEIYAYFMERYDGELLFFVTSDHGRALGDDLDVGYGSEWRKQKHSVHDYNLRVPFLILPSERVREARRIAGPCSQVDFVPTLLDWLELPLPHPSPGVSLLGAIQRGEPLPAGRPIYVRTSAFGHWSDGLVYGGRKYVQFFQVPSGELAKRRVFDLANDPRETRSVADDFGEVGELMRRAASDHGFSFESSFDDVDPKVREQLRALGYLDEDP
jgi:arylsulfatase A-like enzyme